jgi:hypothetical protein
MSTADLTAAQVMDDAAALMNDSQKVTYTYTAQIPYLRIAMNELQELFQLNNIPAAQVTSSVIQVNAGLTEIVFNGVGVPALPADLIEIQQLWERNRGIDPFLPMTRKDYLPHSLEGIPISMFVYWVWEDQKIKFLASNQNNDIKIDYIKTLFPDLVDQSSLINIINSRTFLGFRTAGLMSEFIERNITSANAHNGYAVLALDRVNGINIKGKQAIQTRRRPFRASFKRRGTVFTG